MNDKKEMIFTVLGMLLFNFDDTSQRTFGYIGDVNVLHWILCIIGCILMSYSVYYEDIKKRNHKIIFKVCLFVIGTIILKYVYMLYNNRLIL